MKKKAIAVIYKQFDRWVNDQQVLSAVCTSGCATCCTQNVNITAMEAETILDYILAQDMVENFADALATSLQARTGMAAPDCTINELARTCLAGEEPPEDEEITLRPCPFLEKDLCSIYPVRPFGCRLFLSTVRCNSRQPAITSEFYLDAATACSQLIEHLGQKEYWGNMLDILAAILDIGKYTEIGKRLEQQTPGLIIQAKLRSLAAIPLPGLLLEEAHLQKIEPLLTAIFTHPLDGRSVEDILNGH